MPVIIGIDEAGYGPVLGPLVVCSAAFDVAQDAGDADLWNLLEPAAARTRRGATGRIVVADSKAIYGGGRGLDDLERAVLAFLEAGGDEAPPSFRQLLRKLCADADPLCEAAWWNDLPLPAAAARDVIESATRLLRPAQSRARFLGFAAQIVPPGPFNQFVARHGNKATLLFRENMALVERAIAQFPCDLVFLIDKHGGRHYYDRLLANQFFGQPLRIIRQSPASSSYEVALPDRVLRFTFMEKADGLHLPVALASMTCKYLRELFMMCFNAYWCGRVVGLAPTAGYAADSGRFIDAIRPLLKNGAERDVIRER